MNLMLHYGFSALVAQRIEQLPSKQWVVGSIPARGTILFKHLHISRQGILIRFPLFSHWEHHTFQRIFCVWISGKSGGRSSSLNCPMQQTVQRKEFQLSVFSGRKIQNG